MPSVSPLTSPKKNDGWPEPALVSNNFQVMSHEERPTHKPKTNSVERPLFQTDAIEPNVDNNAMYSSIMN